METAHSVFCFCRKHTNHEVLGKLEISCLGLTSLSKNLSTHYSTSNKISFLLQIVAALAAVAAADAGYGYGGYGGRSYGYGGYSRGYGRYGKREAEAEPGYGYGGYGRSYGGYGRYGYRG